LIAGDCVYTYENWRGDDEATHLPAGLYTDLVEYESSFRKIENLRCEVIPSHDAEVVAREVFS
jgi:N-acyl homoserine lactone hydrolase